MKRRDWERLNALYPLVWIVGLIVAAWITWPDGFVFRMYLAAGILSLIFGILGGIWYRRDTDRWRSKRFAACETYFRFGDRVSIKGSSIWTSGGSGTIGSPPGEIVEKTGPWIEGIASPLEAGPLFWVYFDKPLIADGDRYPCPAGAVEAWALSLILNDDPMAGQATEDSDDHSASIKTVH